MTVKCPASMCPLIAKDGSPYGEYDSVCPESDVIENGGCPWWSTACSTGGIQQLVIQAEKAASAALILGPNKPKRYTIGKSRLYDCPRAHECSWQKQAGDDPCPPRQALAAGLDPRVCLF